MAAATTTNRRLPTRPCRQAIPQRQRLVQQGWEGCNTGEKRPGGRARKPSLSDWVVCDRKGEGAVPGPICQRAKPGTADRGTPAPQRQPSRKSPPFGGAAASHTGNSGRKGRSRRGETGTGRRARAEREGRRPNQCALRRAASTVRAPARRGAPGGPTAEVTEDITALASGAVGSTLAWLPVLARYPKGG